MLPRESFKLAMLIVLSLGKTATMKAPLQWLQDKHKHCPGHSWPFSLNVTRKLNKNFPNFWKKWLK
jgi:hypothetical protein